jgi:threonylcarbamoyladenosine tRNA methylthiotransferase MtaB
MQKLKIAITTVGCRSNQADSSTIIYNLDPQTTEIVEDFSMADIAVINTCLVTSEAERDCRKLARRAQAASDCRVIVTGCAVSGSVEFGKDLGDRVERRGGGDADPAGLARWINELAGTEYISETPEKTVVRIGGRTRAVVKIQNGCCHHCAYCIVPTARGPEKSLSHANVLAECARLKKEGFTEVVLSGIQIGAWGTDLPGHPPLADLLTESADCMDPGRIRLSSIEPWSVDKSLLEAMANSNRICSHLHMPLQSGDNHILETMGRGYTVADYLSRVKIARDLCPDISIGTDVLLGFPGEDQEAFENTLRTIKEIRPAYVHAFPYSPREGTRAAKMENRPQKSIARERVRTVRALGQELSDLFKTSQIGKTREIVVEERRNDCLHGLTDNYLPVVITQKYFPPGRLIQATLGRGTHKTRLTAVPLTDS